MNDFTKPLFGKIVYSKTYTKFKKTINDLRKRFSDKIFTILFVNLALVVFQFIYLRLRYAFVNSQIPLWYTKMWGDYQLAGKDWLYLFPAMSLLILVAGLVFTLPIRRYYARYGMTLIGIFTISTNIMLTLSLVRIIFRASAPFKYLVNPIYVDLIIPGLAAFIAMHFILPRFIKYAREKDLVTSPEIHTHPGMLLSEPSARGGGFIYGVALLALSVLFVGLPSYLIAFYVALFLISFLGLLDDYQNTHPETKFRFLENPSVRLGLLFLVVGIVSTMGTKIFSISSPFGEGSLIFGSQILSALVTTIWIVWLLNVLSWSNGIDGQYSGIVGVASVLIILLALRFDPLKTEDTKVAIVAAISAGLAFGFTKFTWHPSKILWGFGAMSAGLALAVLSILIKAKVITSIIIILIPFLDAFVTVLRRVLQKKNPLRGDRGHLHHILLSRGWGVRKIALFYWITTALFGGIGYLTAEKLTIQMGLTLVGLVAFIIILLNLSLRKGIMMPESSPEEKRA